MEERLEQQIGEIMFDIMQEVTGEQMERQTNMEIDGRFDDEMEEQIEDNMNNNVATFNNKEAVSVSRKETAVEVTTVERSNTVGELKEFKQNNRRKRPNRFATPAVRAKKVPKIDPKKKRGRPRHTTTAYFDECDVIIAEIQEIYRSSSENLKNGSLKSLQDFRDSLKKSVEKFYKESNKKSIYVRPVVKHNPNQSSESAPKPLPPLPWIPGRAPPSNLRTYGSPKVPVSTTPQVKPVCSITKPSTTPQVKPVCSITKPSSTVVQAPKMRNEIVPTRLTVPTRLIRTTIVRLPQFSSAYSVPKPRTVVVSPNIRAKILGNMTTQTPKVTSQNSNNKANKKPVEKKKRLMLGDPELIVVEPELMNMEPRKAAMEPELIILD